MNQRNIGVFAHVDAGKTTLTEQMLYHSGLLRKAGRVDNGTAATDDMDIERRRGISIRSKCAAFEWKNTRIQIIDTPGHLDFAAEAERAMWALDGAILLVDAREGLRSYSVLLEKTLRKYGVPYIVFINKVDINGSDPAGVITAANRRLKSVFYDATDVDNYPEAAAELDDELAEKYLEGTLSAAEAGEYLAKAASEGRCHPVFIGSALKDIGVTELMDAVIRFLPPPHGNGDDELSGVIFGTETDRAMGKGAQLRLFSGTLKARDIITVNGRKPSKITKIKGTGLGADKYDIQEAHAGDVVTLFGLEEFSVGDTLGREESLPKKIAAGTLQTPLMMIGVEPEKGERIKELHEALKELDSENPLLSLEWDPFRKKLHLHIMGLMQTDVLREMIGERYGINVVFTEPTIIYKETPLRYAEGGYAYTMPKPCWAILYFSVEPGERGSGVQFTDIVPKSRMDVRYRKQVRQTLSRALRQGLHGWEVTDLRITMIDGQDHQWHTHPLDFALCTPIALMTALSNAGTKLLEPYVTAEFVLPEEMSGKLMSEIMEMRGSILSADNDNGIGIVTAEMPAKEALRYPVRFMSMTNGKGSMTTSFTGYKDCPDGFLEETEYRGVYPLDTSRYILAMRNAMDVEDLR